MKNNSYSKINEVTSDSTGSRGSYSLPMQPSLKIFKKSQLEPFTIDISKFDNAELYADSLDGNMDESESEIRKMETVSKKISKFKKNHPTQNDEDGDNINPYPSKVNEWFEISNGIVKESNTSVTAGLYNGPLELGLKKWGNSLDPFNFEVNHDHNVKSKKSKLKDNISKVVGVWEKNKDGSHHIPTHDAGGKKEKKINEDLAVWFGTKKKPKGSKQPKGPWVNICRKDENGKHPPCGRPEATDKGYPKCRAAGVAGKMSDSEKRSACQQKRRVEKSNPKSGTGNKPKMVSYKPKNESNIKITEEQLVRLYKNLI